MALKVVLTNWKAVAVRLEQVAAEANDDRALAHGLLKGIKLVKFLMYLRFILDVFSTVNFLSETSQDNMLCLPEVWRGKVEGCMMKLEALQQCSWVFAQQIGRDMTKVTAHTNLRDVDLIEWGNQSVPLDSIKEEKAVVTGALISSLAKRMLEDRLKVVDDCHVLNPKAKIVCWGLLSMWCVNELGRMTEHFSNIPTPYGASLEEKQEKLLNEGQNWKLQFATR